jgi:hypothetical protein
MAQLQGFVPQAEAGKLQNGAYEWRFAKEKSIRLPKENPFEPTRCAA